METLKKAAAMAGAVINWLAASLGYFVMALLVMAAWRWFGPSSGEAPKKESAEQAQPVAAEKEASCACADNARCNGPRGGVYCLTPGGAKKYF